MVLQNRPRGKEEEGWSARGANPLWVHKGNKGDVLLNILDSRTGSPEVLEGLGRSGWPVGTLCTYPGTCPTLWH